MKAIYCILGLVLLSNMTPCYGWWLKSTYQGGDFFNHFDFWNGNDPTHGYVNYVDAGSAWNKGLVNTNGGVAYIGTDTKNVAGGRGRDSVRLHSKETVTSGSLVLADISHMPVGCGTWPAFWMVGQNWPHGGEIDIIEGVNNQANNQATLHTDGGCWMDPGQAWQFNGAWAKTPSGGPSNNCDVNAPGQYANAGCGIIGGQYGHEFNNNGGGVYATLWTGDTIAIYHFQRSTIPGDIKSGNPNPASWPRPMAKFQLGGNCPSSHFGPQQIIINLTFCGDWAGGVFGQNCPGQGDCVSHVRDHPWAFNDAFWKINSIKIYRQ